MAETKVPPQNLEAEQSVLGALLIDKDGVVVVSEFLRPEHFYKEAHGQIYKSILSLFEKREPIDIVTLSQELKEEGIYDEIGGSSYLSELVNFVPTAANITHYGRIVKDHHTKRQLIQIATRVVERSFDTVGDVKELLDFAETSIFGVSQAHLQQFFLPVKEALVESFDRLEELHKKGAGLRGVATGFGDLDNLLAGLQDSNLIILASRPGQGKSALALNIAQHASVHEKLPVGIFSLEMSKEELVDRLLVWQAKVDAWRLKTGRLEDTDFEKIQEAMGELAEAPLYIDDTPACNILEIRTKARRLQIERGLKLLIVDYLQLIRGRNLENRVQEVSEISQSLKNLARELKIPVLAISQLSRAVEQRGSKRPQLADLRESGALEQDADVVMFLYREDPDNMEETILDIQKHRNGKLGQIPLHFIPHLVGFVGSERKREK
jgi:replicative DNA helicase